MESTGVGMNDTNLVLQFKATVELGIKNFENCALFHKLQAQKFTIGDYHNCLLSVFHQTYNGPSTFALAGAVCSNRHREIKDYLILHAEEEKSHWKWVLSDLEKTGYKGLDPRSCFPITACESYIAYNFYVAQYMPLARLGIAAVLEGIGGSYGGKIARLISSVLNLKKDQVTFAFGHSDTDVGHSKEIFDILESSVISPEEWSQLNNAAAKASILYPEIFNSCLLTA